MPPKLIHILLVEDDPVDAQLFQEGLAQARGIQFALTQAERLEEALGQLHRRAFDVVVLDVGLPDSKGLEGLEKIRAAARAIPILLFTGLDDEAVALSALQQGAQDYLIKGRADDQALARAIRYAIERKHGEELERAKEALEAANRAKDHFLAVLSHELRNPLTPVLPALATLEQLVFPEGREYLDMARRNVELEARLIDDLLDVTRIARGKVELDCKPVDLAGIVQRAAEVCAPDIEARGLHFGLLSDDEPHYVHADAARLLRADGHQVSHAGDVATALELAERESFDLLLSDLGLPDGSGHDLMRQLVAQGHHLPAIALSGYGMATDVQHSREAGFAQHLTKPVDLERLRSAIARVTT